MQGEAQSVAVTFGHGTFGDGNDDVLRRTDNEVSQREVRYFAQESRDTDGQSHLPNCADPVGSSKEGVSGHA
jgi:hypothetical protein